jgi:hypothetical protein
MYRTPQPPTDDPLLVLPGEGLRGIRVGEATPKDVLRVFGRDCRISSFGNDGDVDEISYDYGPSYDLAGDRPEQWVRPAEFGFRFGLLEIIEVGIYQKDLCTIGGLRIGSTREHVIAALGPGEIVGEGLRYVTLGIELRLDEKLGLTTWYVFRARRTD